MRLFAGALIALLLASAPAWADGLSPCTGDCTFNSINVVGTVAPNTGIYSGSSALRFGVNGTANAVIFSSSGGIFLGGSNGALSTGDIFAIQVPGGNSSKGATIQNSSNGAAAATTFFFGNDGGTTQGGISLNSSGNSGAGGASSMNITAASGPIAFSLGGGAKAVLFGTAGQGFFGGAAGALNTGDIVAMQAVSGNSSKGASLQNANNGAAAATTLFFGNDTNANQASISLNSSGNSGGGGVSALNVNGVKMALQTGGTNAITISAAQAIGMPGLSSSSAAQTGTVCWTTGTGNLTVDTTTTCLLSLEELKDIKGPITNALSTIMALRPFWFTWKSDAPAAIDTAEQPGLGAHQVAGVDPRLAAYGTDGKLRGVRYQEMAAVLVAAIQEQQYQAYGMMVVIGILTLMVVFLVVRCRRA